MVVVVERKVLLWIYAFVVDVNVVADRGGVE
jgi:hypothetical protein